jgi:2-keto-3-deoxy-L-rhamnonate aldolase RhmA
MGTNKLFDKMRAGKVALGVANSYPSTGLIEGMSIGWDFVWIDGQHGHHAYESIHQAILAATVAGVDTLVRVPSHDSSVLCQYADLSPSAIMVPMVNTAEAAVNVVKGLYFPPLGDRSYGGRRVIDLHGRNYFSEMELLVVAQIETLEAVDNADGIIGTEGIGALFFGPDDMKVRMNIPIDTMISESKELQVAMKRTAEAANRHGKIAGIVATNPSDLQVAVDTGYKLIAGGGDTGFVKAGSSSRLKELRSVLDSTYIVTQQNSSTGIY